MRSSRRVDERSELPLTLPVGPWASWDGAQAALDSWCKDSTTGGGGWGTSTRDSKASNSVRGAQRVLACHFHTLAKGNCKWRLTLEDTTEGWAIHSVNSAHNHALVQSLAEANSHAGMRNIPDELKSIAQMLAQAAQPPAQINRVLVSHWANTKGADPTWNYKDVHSFVSATAVEKAFDATGFLEKLAERNKLLGLPFYMATDADGRLSRVLFVMEGGLEAYARCISFGDDDVTTEAAVQYDVTVRWASQHPCMAPLLVLY
jgi:hypothetical protein